MSSAQESQKIFVDSMPRLNQFFERLPRSILLCAAATTVFGWPEEEGVRASGPSGSEIVASEILDEVAP